MIHEGSTECAPAGVDIFSAPCTQTAISKRTKADFYPVANLSDLGPLEFAIPASEDDYWDLNDHCLEVKFKVVKQDGANVTPTDKVAPVNFLLHSLFRQVDLYLNGKLVSTAYTSYPYKAYLEKQLNYDKNVKTTQFGCELYTKDEAGKMDDNDPTNEAANSGLVGRFEYTKSGQTVTLRGSLHIDFLRQERLLLNQVDIRIKLSPNKPEYFLMSPETDSYSIKMISARLEMVKVGLHPSVLNRHNLSLNSQNAKYPMRRTEIKTFTIPQGDMHVVKENMYTGQMPRRIVIGVLESDAYHGNFKKCPFNFKNFNLNYVCAFIDGERFPSRALTPNFATNDYLEAYETLFTGNGIKNDLRTIDITRKEYPNGYSLVIIPFCPSEPDSVGFDLIRNGTLRLEMKFAQALPTSATVIVYGEFDSVLEITKDRQVVLDH